jgi:hypothetical protein
MNDWLTEQQPEVLEHYIQQSPAWREHAQAFEDMNAKPLASVQMFTYNHAPYIRRAVESVLSQRTDFPFELVIGEDCSTDGTREIVVDYHRWYPEIVRVVTSEQNVGMHRNVLRTQEACRGEFVAFCEGDDFWHDPAKLQIQVEFLVQTLGYGMAHCNYDAYEVARGRLRRRVISSPPSLQDDRAYVEVLLRRRRIMTLAVCVRRDLLETVVREQPECTDERWPMGDTQRWLEICRLTKVKYFPQAMATYNFLPESACQSRRLLRQSPCLPAGVVDFITFVSGVMTSKSRSLS